MKLGLYPGMDATDEKKIGMDRIGYVKQAGFDYIELSLMKIAALTDDEFDHLKKTLKENNIVCEVCNNMIYDHIKLTGPAVDLTAVKEYAITNFSRAAQLGCEIIVLGSAPARNLPENFSYEEGYRQFVDITKNVLAPIAKENGILLVIEPQNTTRCNLILTIKEAVEMEKAVDCGNVKTLADFYHMAVDNEPLDEVGRYIKHIQHVHVAEMPNRKITGEILSPAYKEFLNQLKTNDYQGRVTIEAFCDSFFEDAQTANQLLREYLD